MRSVSVRIKPSLTSQENEASQEVAFIPGKVTDL